MSLEEALDRGAALLRGERAGGELDSVLLDCQHRARMIIARRKPRQPRIARQHQEFDFRLVHGRRRIVARRAVLDRVETIAGKILPRPQHHALQRFRR
jgi:hypothetical protein